jgi:hypothetical protein
MLAALRFAAAAQVSFEQATRDLASADSGFASARRSGSRSRASGSRRAARGSRHRSSRRRAVCGNRGRGEHFPADKIVPRKRVALVIELRHKIAADEVFSAGPLAIGPGPCRWKC